MTCWQMQHRLAQAARESKEDAIRLCVGCIAAGSGCVNHRCAMPAPLSGFRLVGYNQPLTSATGQGDLRCPPTNNARTVIGW